jgi:hypothetical protein
MSEDRPEIRGWTVERESVPDYERPGRRRDVLKLTLWGDHFHVGATPIRVAVGDVPAIPVDGGSRVIVCHLHEQPPEGAPVVVEQGDLRLEAPEPFTIRALEQGRGG